MTALSLRGGRTTSGDRIDLDLVGGVVATVARELGAVPEGAELLDATGRVIMPAFAETHVHVEKAYLPVYAGDLAGAIAATAAQKRSMTATEIVRRAERVLEQLVGSGTTLLRAHVEVDRLIGDRAIGALRDLRRRWVNAIRIQIAVFPQEGLFTPAADLGLFRALLESPDSVVGGCPYVEADAAAARRHVDLVLDVAAALGVSADLHLDFSDAVDDERFVLAEYTAREVVARGLEHRVAIGHATSLARLAPPARTRVIDALAAAGVSVAVLPATDLHLMQRRDRGEHGTWRGIAPIRELWAAGVRTVVSSNNIRNSFSPTGRGDILEIAQLLARLLQVATRDDATRVLEMATVNGRSVVDPQALSGLVPGAPAELVLIPGGDAADVLFESPLDRTAIHNGRVVATRRMVTTWSPSARSSRAEENE